MPVITDEQFSEPLTTTEAAQRLAVGKSTISKWAARGHLRPYDIDAYGKPLYRFGDVLRCARQRGHRILIQPAR